MEKSLNQIRVELKDVATAHAQVNSFFWGDLVRAWNEENLNFPLMCSYSKGSGHQFLNNQTQVQLIILVADKQFEDWGENLNDVESDTLQIIRDVYNVVNKSPRWQSLGKVQTAVVTKFIDDTGDGLTGHVLELTFLLRDQSGYCDLPIFGYDFEDTEEGDGCQDGRVINSDLTFDDVVASGGILELPDITIIDSDGSPISWPSAKNFTCTPPVGTTSAAQLMKTGQTTSYNSDDDGDLQEGRPTDFLTLDHNNPFGNTDRLTDTLGGQVYADGVVMDWSTLKNGKCLMYYLTLLDGGNNWATLVNNCAALSVGVFTTGWRMTNIRERDNIWDLEQSSPFDYAPFNFTGYSLIWASNTVKGSTGNAYYIQPNGAVNIGGKGATIGSAIAVRTATVTGTTIT